MPNQFHLPDSSLYEDKQHGTPQYPVVVYHSDLHSSNMKYIPWHWHDEVELNIVTKGAALFKANEITKELTPGQGQFVNQNVLHSVHPVDETTPCEFFSIVFHPSFLFGYGQTFLSSKYLTPILASEELKHIILLPEIDWQKHILDICKEIADIQDAGEFGCELRVKEKLCALWLAILTQWKISHIEEGISTKQSGNVIVDETRVKKAILYMEEHHSESVTLDDIAAAVHISKSECCRCFKRTLNLTPFEYLMRFRIFEATRKMQRQEPIAQSISDLAFSVGFNNTSYFNKLFKQFLQCTPKEYKKQLLSQNNLAAQNNDYVLHYSPLENTSHTKFFTT
ncbi:MAG: helix-turn-helix transcriptional regulator [Lachnospiraceae bacterium]|nr:helix-turn-helix transcriptional regulator [Lachnospiraceae bacterium]